MLSEFLQSKVSVQAFANEIAKAQALVKAGVMTATPEGDYLKNCGSHWKVSMATQVCDCPAYVGRFELGLKMEDLHYRILVCDNEKELKFMERQLRGIEIGWPGVICKHLLCALALANLISLKDLWHSFRAEEKAKAKPHYTAELEAELKVKAGDESGVRVLPRTHAEAPIMAPVILVKGKVATDPATKRRIQWGIPLSANRLPHLQLHFLCEQKEDGNFDVEGTLARAQALFPAEHYSVQRVEVRVESCALFQPLPERFVNGIYS